MSRVQSTLAGALTVQIILILIIQSPFGSAFGSTEPRPLFPALESFTASRVEVEDGEGETLAIVRDGDEWGIEEAGGYPADADKMKTLVDDLKGIQVQRPIVSSNRYHSSLKVGDKDFERHLRIWGESSGEPEIDLYIGSSPNVGLTNVRTGGDDAVYEVGGIAAYQVRAEKAAWIKGRFLDARATQVERFMLVNAGGSFELVKEEGNWRVVSPSTSRKLDSGKVDTFLQSVATLWVTEPAGAVDNATQGFDRPVASFEVRVEGSEPVTVRVGGVVPEQDTYRYITRSGFGYAATIAESSVRTLIDEKLADLFE
jgi:hypothetical protein